MPISVQCESCDREFKVKEEFAGRRVKCPGCQSQVAVPDDDDLLGGAPVQTPKPKRREPVYRKSSPWYIQHWHWLVVAAVLLLAVWQTVGIYIAGMVAFVGIIMALIGGLIPFFRILFGAPGTVLLMIVSRSARFEMMDQPDSHPYKVLVRTAFTPTRGLFWRGVLLMVAFIPAAFVHGAASEFFRRNNRPANPVPPPGFGPGGGAPGPGVLPGNHAGAAGQPGMPGHPGMPGAMPQNPAEPNRTFYVKLTYKAYQGLAAPTQGAQALVADLPGYIADTLKVDEETRTIRFEHKGSLIPGTTFPLFSKHGFNGINFSSSTNPD